MIGQMKDITETAEPVIDIWPSVEQLVRKGIVLQYVYENELVESVYGNSSFHHVLLPTAIKDNFVVLIINLAQQTIDGYYRLDLKKEYGV